jgi:hypothetical protein
MVSVNTKAENARFEDCGFRYSDGLLARSTNWFLRNYFLLLENYIRFPAGMSHFAILVRQE